MQPSNGQAAFVVCSVELSVKWAQPTCLRARSGDTLSRDSCNKLWSDVHSVATVVGFQ
jgi:hypothetical protein